MYSMYYLCVAIILFNMGLQKSAFSTDSFGKLFSVSFWAFCVFCLFCVEFDVSLNFLKLNNYCLHSTRCKMFCAFVITSLKQFVKTDTRHKNVTISLNKNMSPDSFCIWVLKIPFIKKNVNDLQAEKVKKRYQQIQEVETLLCLALTAL